MDKLFEVQAWELSNDAVKTYLTRDGQVKLLNLSRGNYEQWLIKADRLNYFPDASVVAQKCPLADYWKTIHPSFIQRDLYDYITARHFLSQGCAYDASRPGINEYKQQQRVKELCYQLRDMLAYTIVMVNDLEDSSPAEQHNSVAHLSALAQDIKALTLQLGAACRMNAIVLSSTAIDDNGKMISSSE